MTQTSMTPPLTPATTVGRILVLDDSPAFHRALAGVLEQEFEVVIVRSRDDAVALCEHWLPDCLVLDIENVEEGLSACRALAGHADLPLLFCAAAASHRTRLAAFEAGASDFLGRPVDPQALLHKARRSVAYRQRLRQSDAERASLQTMAMGFLSHLGESGILMNFVRASLGCKSHAALADNLVAALRELGLSCFGEIRQPGGVPVHFCSDDAGSELEDAVMSTLSVMGRLFQFSSRLVVNYPQVSIVVRNLPKGDDAQVGRIRDNVAILAETADTLCENVQMRQSAIVHAEQLQLAMMQANTGALALRDSTRQMLLDTRLLLQELEDTVQHAYAWLGTTATQEQAISTMMDTAIQRILQGLSRVDIDQQMAAILAAMSVGEDAGSSAELF